MKVFTFMYDEYPYNTGNVQYDIVIANNIEEAKQIRKKSLSETFCPSSTCKIEEVEIKPGFFRLDISNSYMNDRYVKPLIIEYP